MAVVLWVREDWDGRGGSSDGLLKQKATRVWKIKTDNKLMDHNDLAVSPLVAANIPLSLYTPHPNNFYLTSRSLKFTQESASPYFWKAEVEYSSEPIREEDREREDTPNPLDRPPKITMNSVQYQRTVVEDRDGNPIVNKAGDPFDPADLMIDDARWTVKVSANVNPIPAWVLTRNNRLNSVNFILDYGGGLTVLAGKAKVQGLAISDLLTEGEDGEFEFYELSYELNFKAEGWAKRLINAGFHYLTTASDYTTRKVIDIGGKRPSTEVPLDSDGTILADPSPANVIVLEFDVYEEDDFTDMPGILPA